MANHLNPELSQIIRDISYGNGTLYKLRGLIKRLQFEKARIEERLKQLPLELAEAEAEMQRLIVETGRVQKRAKEKYPKLSIEDIRPVVPTPKRGDWTWGEFKRELIFVLKAAQGKPVSTKVLVEHCVIRFGLPTSTIEERRFLRSVVRKPLRQLAAQGAVERLHNPNPSAIAYWRWIAPGGGPAFPEEPQTEAPLSGGDHDCS